MERFDEANKFQDAMVAGKAGRSVIKKLYDEYKTDRDKFLSPAEVFSRMTLPWILPEGGTRGEYDDQHGWQSIGARLLNHLSNKIANTLFPANKSYFKAELTPAALTGLLAEGFKGTDLNAHLAKIQDNARNEAEKLGAAVARIEASKHLLIGGNVCIYTPMLKSANSNYPFEDKMQVIPLSHYVCKRDNNSNLLDFITFQEKEVREFDPVTKLKLQAAANRGKTYKLSEKIKVYTRAHLVKGMYEITQCVKDIPIGDKQLIHPFYLPWNCLIWNKRYGQHYGGGLVEDYAGSFFKLEFLNEALTKGLMLMADIKYLVKHGATLDIDELENSEMGDILAGNLEEIGVLQLEKYADFTPIREVVKETERELGSAFLLNSANRRDAERVTTYELRLDAQEMEVTLGGVYSMFAEDWQKPEARALIKRLDMRLNETVIEPTVSTGLNALGKLNDLDKMHQFTEFMQLPAAWPEPMQKAVKWSEYANQVADNLSLKTSWLKTATEVQADDEAEQNKQLQLMAAQGAANSIPDVTKGVMGGGK